MMKRLLFIAVMLWSVAFGQSKGYIRYDSVYIQKIGGNGELILENGTRNVTGGVLTNMGGGRTQFVTPTSGGQNFGQKDTLIGQRYVNNQDSSFSWKNSTVKFGAEKTQVGQRYNYNFNSTNFRFVESTPNATVTATSSGLIFDGGAATRTDYVETPDSVHTFGGHNWILRFSVIGVDYDNASLGFSIEFTPQGNGQGLHTLFRLTDTAAYINGNLSAALPTAHTYSSKDYYTFKRSAGDTLDVVMQRTSYGYTAYMINRANKSSMQIAIPQVQTSDCKIRIYGFGGEWKFINNLILTYQDIVNPSVILMGNSETTNLTGYSENTSWRVQSFTGIRGSVVDLSGAAEQSIDGERRAYEIVRTYAPSSNGVKTKVGWRYNVNDRNGSVNIDSTAARTRRAFDILEAAGFEVFAIAGTPQTAGSIVPYNDTLEFICQQRGLLFIDVYEILVASAGTAMDAKYNYGDGIHVNQLGADVEAKKIRQVLLDSGYIEIGSPVTIDAIPFATTNYHELVESMDGSGGISKRVAGTFPGYLWVRSAANGATVFQTGNYNLHGDAAITSVHWGSTWQNNANVLDDVGVTSIAGKFSSTLLVGPPSGANRFEVTTTDITVATKKFQFFNHTGALIETNSLPFRIDRFLPQSGSKVGFWHRNSNSGGGVVQSDFRQFAFENPSDTVAYMDWKGGIVSDSFHRYVFDYQSAIVANDRAVPDVGAVKALITTFAPALSDGDKGDITVASSGTVWTIDNDVVTYAKMQNVSATSRFIGRITAGAGDAEELSGTQATTLLDVFTSGLKGLAPASGGGTTNFLRADGTWAAPGGGGGGSPGGSSGQMQWNDGGVFNGTSGATATATVVTLISARATTDFSPTTNDGASLGTSSLRWSDADFADGAVIRWNNSYTLTHSTNLLTASSGFTANSTITSGLNLQMNGASSALNINNRANPTSQILQIYGNDANTVNLFANSADRWTFKVAGSTAGNFGIGTTSPTAYLHIKAGTTSASSAPIKLTSGTSMTSAEAGAVEFTTDDLFFTITTGTARKRFIFADQTAGLTSGTVPVATTNGRLTDGLIIASNTYTSTLTNTTNITSSSQVYYSYQRVGNIVTISIKVSVTATGAGATELGISIPVSSNFTTTDQLALTGLSDQQSAFVESDATNDRIKLTYTATGALTDVFVITGQYTIL